MSVANLQVVKGMELVPNACVICGSNPVDDVTGEIQEAIFAPGVDVDWGGSLYICWGCANIVADLCGRVTVEGFDKLSAENTRLKKELKGLGERYEHDTELVRRIREGNAAVHEVKGDKQPKPKSKSKKKVTA